MAVLFQLHIPDPEDVPKYGKPLLVGMDFRGMTEGQADTATQMLRMTADRIEEHMKKYGTGEVLPEPGDDPQAGSFDDDDRRELQEELAQDAPE